MVAALLLGGDDSDDAVPGSAPAAEADLTGRVVHVVDGDTIDVRLEGDGVERVRYIGIDTPESVDPESPVECFGPEASGRNSALVAGRVVTLVHDAERRDDFGRLLAYVYADDALVQEELLRGGFATTLEIEPNTSMAARFAALEKAAQESGAGLWGECR